MNLPNVLFLSVFFVLNGDTFLLTINCFHGSTMDLLLEMWGQERANSEALKKVAHVPMCQEASFTPITVQRAGSWSSTAVWGGSVWQGERKNGDELHY